MVARRHGKTARKWSSSYCRASSTARAIGLADALRESAAGHHVPGRFRPGDGTSVTGCATPLSRARTCAGPQPPLTFGIAEIVACAWFSAALGDAVPVIAAWMAVQMAWDTFG